MTLTTAIVDRETQPCPNRTGRHRAARIRRCQPAATGPPATDLPTEEEPEQEQRRVGQPGRKRSAPSS
jgi:hypothetical protein